MEVAPAVGVQGVCRALLHSMMNSRRLYKAEFPLSGAMRIASHSCAISSLNPASILLSASCRDPLVIYVGARLAWHAFDLPAKSESKPGKPGFYMSDSVRG